MEMCSCVPALKVAMIRFLAATYTVVNLLRDYLTHRLFLSAIRSRAFRCNLLIRMSHNNE